MDGFRTQCARRHFMLDKPLKSLPCSGHQMQTHLLHTNAGLGSQKDGCWARDHNALPPAQTLEDETFHFPGLREVSSLHLTPLQQKPPHLQGLIMFSPSPDHLLVKRMHRSFKLHAYLTSPVFFYPVL